MACPEMPPSADENKRFYVYVYRDPRPGRSSAPIYVGKGSGSQKRANWHWVHRAENRILRRVLEKIRAIGLAPIIEIDSRFDDETDALERERELIAEFGRRNTNSGTLANLTDGGEGFSGWIATTKHRAQSSARLKVIRREQWKDQAFRELSLANLAKGRADARVRQKAVQGIIAAKDALAADPARSAAQSEQRSKLRAAAWAVPGTRQKYIDGLKSTRSVRSAKMRERWEDPEYRSEHGAKVGAATKAAWADPETRMRRIEAIRAGRRAKRP